MRRHFVVLIFLSLLGTTVLAQNMSSIGTIIQGHSPRGSAGAMLRASAATGTDTFETFLRYPVPTNYFVVMDALPGGPTAYYRDAFTAGETFTTSAADGDTISAKILDANSNPIGTWAGYTFHVNWIDPNGQPQQYCWVGNYVNDYLCGGQSIDVTWYRQSQCGDGTFTMQFFHNSNKYYEGTFTILPQIKDSEVVNYNQVAYDGPGNEYDSLCRYVDAQGRVINAREKHTCDNRANEIPFYIRAKGCYLTSAANVLSNHSVAVDPWNLNAALDALTNPAGYVAGNVNPPGLHSYALNRGGTLNYRGTRGDLSQNVCQYGPQIIGVHCSTDPRTGRRNPGHWVTVIGRDEAKTTWLLHDPNGTVGGGTQGGARTTLDNRYNNDYCAARIYSGPEYTVTTNEGIAVHFHSPVALLLTDDQGRREGDDPVAGTFYDEIPNAYYDAGGLDDDELEASEDDPNKELFVPTPPSGEYTLTVTGVADGSYSADFFTYDSNGAVASKTSVSQIPIGLNQVQTFTFNYPAPTGSSFPLSGGFDGGGQRPRDVNKFLTYVNPTSSQTSLPVGTQQFPVFIFYAPATIPSTFHVLLNGTDVTALFHPIAGSGEVVNLPLQMGKNVVQLSIDGNLTNRIATDTDRLVLSVQ